jgi:aminoglycoside phosphotransferase
MTEQRLAAPARLVTGYAAWEWTAVSCYAEQTTWRLDRAGARARFVKVARVGAYPGLAAEADRTRWAGAHGLPVPEVIATGSDGTVDWLVTAGISGLPGTDPTLGDVRQVVTALAEGLRRLHDSAPVAECPFDFRLVTAMAHATRRVAAGLVDPAEDFDEEHGHLDSQGALDQLGRLRPDGEDLVVCHGDYCPPNALITHGRVTGYVDLGELGVADQWWDVAVATRAVTWNYGPGLESLFLLSTGRCRIRSARRSTGFSTTSHPDQPQLATSPRCASGQVSSRTAVLLECHDSVVTRVLVLTADR